MALKVVPATEADAPRAYAIGDLAYASNPVGSILYPGPFPPLPDGSDARAAQLAGMLRDPTCRWVKVIDTDIEARANPDEDPMVAFSAWYLWDTPQPPATAQQYGPGTNPEALELFHGSMRERRNATMGGKPYVCMSSPRIRFAPLTCPGE